METLLQSTLNTRVLEILTYREVQKIAKDTIEYIIDEIKPGMTLKEIRFLCEEKMRELGADSFWYYDIGAFVFAGDETTVSVEEISCTGCKPENWCRYHVVKCCRDRGITNCSECTEYPCRNMKECFEVTGSFEPKCKEVCTEAEYLQLKAAFFEKEQNLERCRYRRNG